MSARRLQVVPVGARNAKPQSVSRVYIKPLHTLTHQDNISDAEQDEREQRYAPMGAQQHYDRQVEGLLDFHLQDGAEPDRATYLVHRQDTPPTDDEWMTEAQLLEVLRLTHAGDANARLRELREAVVPQL